MLVGHSHYFREALKHFRAASCTLAAADGASMDSAQLDHKKLSNAGVIKCGAQLPHTPALASALVGLFPRATSPAVRRCELDFGSSPEKPIVGAQLVFGTSLVD